MSFINLLKSVRLCRYRCRYERLPVMFVDNWASDLFENPHAEELLEETRKRLAPFYAEGSALRKRTLEVCNQSSCTHLCDISGLPYLNSHIETED